MMFAYIFGGLLFGWYGIFLGPLLLVATIHLVRVGVSELASGDPVSADVTSGHGIGTMPRPEQDPGDETVTDDASTTVDG